MQKQKFTPADVERINAEKRELQQTITGLTKSLEEAEKNKWSEEIALSKGKEKVLCVGFKTGQCISSLLVKNLLYVTEHHLVWCM